jgi:hypothetical protein
MYYINAHAIYAIRVSSETQFSNMGQFINSLNAAAFNIIFYKSEVVKYDSVLQN